MNEFSAMFLGLVSGLLLGMWLYPKLIRLFDLLERKAYERKKDAEKASGKPA